MINLAPKFSFLGSNNTGSSLNLIVCPSFMALFSNSKNLSLLITATTNSLLKFNIYIFERN